MNQEVMLREDTDRSKDRTCEKSPDDTKGVGSCYVFKSRLQEYAQKVGIPTPVYQTLKEGPSHEPIFKSTVIVNNVRYDSLPGFFNRKAAEQSAAEIALMEIHSSGLMTQNMPTVHETGLCKNLLQEYAQKMNYAIPSYICTKGSSGATPFTCTVEIGGIQYIGAAARTKKEAEIKAARTALLAIQSQSQTGAVRLSQYTVLPGKRKVKEPEVQAQVLKKIKPKKVNFKKKWPKKRFPRRKNDQSAKPNKNDAFTVPVPVPVISEDGSRVSMPMISEDGSRVPMLMVSEDVSRFPELPANGIQIEASNHDPQTLPKEPFQIFSGLNL